MDYERAYNALIRRARERCADNVTTERHHITPRCIGGGNESENLVDLTLREHYVAHLLLAKIHGGVLWHAAQMIGARLGLGGRVYEKSRERIAKETGERMRELWRDPEYRERMSTEIKKRSACPVYRENMRQKNTGKTLSEDTRKKLSEAGRGKEKTKSHREKIGKAHRGKKFSDETRRKMSDSAKRRAAREIAEGRRKGLKYDQ